MPTKDFFPGGSRVISLSRSRFLDVTQRTPKRALRDIQKTAARGTNWRLKFATFWMLPKSFYHSFVLQMTFMHSTTTLRAESPLIFL